MMLREEWNNNNEGVRPGKSNRQCVCESADILQDDQLLVRTTNRQKRESVLRSIIWQSINLQTRLLELYFSQFVRKREGINFAVTCLFAVYTHDTKNERMAFSAHEREEKRMKSFAGLYQFLCIWVCSLLLLSCSLISGLSSLFRYDFMHTHTEEPPSPVMTLFLLLSQATCFKPKTKQLTFFLSLSSLLVVVSFLILFI